MTAEEKIEFLKALGIQAGGNTTIILEQNNEHNIENVEAGGIGVQIINEAKPGAAKKMDGRKSGASTQPRVTDEVFDYVHKNDEEGRLRLVKFYQYLANPKSTIHFIDQNTTPEDFCALFLGKAAAKKVKWIRPQAELHYLIDQMIKRHLITWADGEGQWIIVGSHFVDADSRPFAKPWNKVDKVPKKMAPALDKLVDVLDIFVPLD